MYVWDSRRINQDNKKPKFRPLILGGDALSVICSADIALRFTNEFLKEFEVQTKKELKNLVDNYDLEEFKEYGVLAGMKFQEHIETLAFLNGGNKQTAPAQRLHDFVNNKLSLLRYNLTIVTL